MGMSAHLSECLSTRTSTIVYFVSSTPPTVYSLFKLCICFAHELMCMWFDHSSFFHLMHISMNGCFREHTSSDFINFWCIPVVGIYEQDKVRAQITEGILIPRVAIRFRRKVDTTVTKLLSEKIF